MAEKPPEKALAKLAAQQVIWFVWLDGRLNVSTDPKSVKSKNIRQNARVALALEDGTSPVICEGLARPVEPPYDEAIQQAFFQKYEWNLSTEQQYTDLLEVTPVKWLAW